MPGLQKLAVQNQAEKAMELNQIGTMYDFGVAVNVWIWVVLKTLFQYGWSTLASVRFGKMFTSFE